MAAANAAGGGSGGGIDTTLQFPLYLDFDYCEYYPDWYSTECVKEGDFTELKRVITLVIEDYGNGGYAGEDVLDDLGIEIYLEGEKVKEFVEEYDSVYISTDTYFYVSVLDYRLVVVY